MRSSWIRGTAVVVVAGVLVAACGGDGESAETTVPEITLLTTTTEPPVFEPETTVSEIETDDDPGSTTLPAAQTTIAAATTVAAETSVPSTTVAASTTVPASPFSIRPDGIGSATFGAAPDGVTDFVSSVLGPPTADTGWIDPFELGPCAGSELRQVSWGSLILEFGDVSNVADGRRHFYGYYYGDGTATPTPAGLATPEGLTVGSTVADLLAVHPNVSLFSGDEFLGPNFQINDALRGTMSGLADNDVITSFVGGLPCTG